MKDIYLNMVSLFNQKIIYMIIYIGFAATSYYRDFSRLFLVGPIFQWENGLSYFPKKVNKNSQSESS